MVGSAADRLLEIELRDFGWLQYGGRATADRGRRNLAWMSGQGGPGRSGRHFRFGGLLEAARLAGSDPTKIASRPPRLASRSKSDPSSASGSAPATLRSSIFPFCIGTVPKFDHAFSRLCS